MQTLADYLARMRHAAGLDAGSGGRFTPEALSTIEAAALLIAAEMQLRVIEVPPTTGRLQALADAAANGLMNASCRILMGEFNPTAAAMMRRWAPFDEEVSDDDPCGPDD